MLRNTADKQVLERTQKSLTYLFNQYATVPASEISSHLASSDPVERDLWEQISLSDISIEY
jgi:hypothetical protein